MDELDMQLPLAKRRKLSNHMPHSQWAQYRVESEDESRGSTHALEPAEQVQVAQEAIRGNEDHNLLLARQATAGSSATITTTPAVSDVGSSISTTSMATTNETTTGAAAISEVATSEGIPRETISSAISSETMAATSANGLALSVLLSASVSLPLSEIASIATGVPVSVVSGLLSDVSGLLAPSEIPSTSSPMSPETASASTSSLGNITTSITSTPSVTSISRNNTTTSSLLPTSTSTGFLTSSFPRNSTITTSATSSSSRTEISSTEISSTELSTTESPIAFVATLSQGVVTTLLRSADAYTVVLDRSTLTISAAETSSSTQASISTDSASTLVSSAIASSSGDRQTTSSIASTAGGAPTSYAAPTSTEPASTSDSNDSSTPPAGTIAGGVVGGAAGLALVALIAMLAVRWYRRQGAVRHQALPQGPGSSPDLHAASSRGPGMAERAGLAPFAAAVPARFKTQGPTAGSEETSDHGFTRVSGRKLPSAFGGGAGAHQSHDVPVNLDDEPDLNETSTYRDSSGFFGGSGSPPSPTGSSPLRGHSYEHMTISPGPQRMPRVHSGGPYNMSSGESAGPSSPHAPTAPARSDAPLLLDPNRNSRFSEGL